MAVSRFPNRGNAKENRGGLPRFVIISWIIIAFWGGLLLAAWNSGLLSKESLLKATDGLKQELSTTIIQHSASGLASKQRDPSIDADTSHTELAKSDIHVIFSTDCNPFQDWQTLVLFHSAVVVGQKGPITRIASGCDEEKKKYLKGLYKKLYPQYHVHFTPDFKHDEKTGRKYDFYNKPWGLKHWLEFSDPPVPNDIVIALLDPDMIFLRPITTQILGMDNNLYNKRAQQELLPKVIKGRPVAQTYGLGAPWTNDIHPKFGRGRICGEGSPCLTPNEPYGAQHYSVGPPYLVEKEDMIRIAKTWTEFVPRVYEKYPYLLAEMYAYSMAAAHENLPHLQMEHYMVSNVDSPGEGWQWVDELDNVCEPPSSNGTFFPNRPLPSVVHFCQGYRVGEIGFGKRGLRKDIFNCDTPMLVEPPTDLQANRYMRKNDAKIDVSKVTSKRNAFMVCVIHRAINAAIVDYKQRMCGGNFTSYEKSINVLGGS